MAKKCIGIREDSGDQCNRSASSGSDFCYKHQSQEDDATILHMGADVYHCPQDGMELFRDYKNNFHRCKSCKGVLLGAKGIDQQVVENISHLDEIESHQEVCPCCGEGANLSIRVVEYCYSKRKGLLQTYGVSNIWFCDDCWSVWIPYFRMPGAALNLRPVDVLLGYYQSRVLGYREVMGISGQKWPSYQMKLREERLEKEAMYERRLANQRAKWCNHVDDQGEQCSKNKSQKSTHDPEYCYKHQPK
ncbi:MAG: hypothetical protein ACJ0HH_02785 [Candidatus Thalassarchaeum sp.]